MSNDDRRTILLRRRQLLVASLATAGLGSAALRCEPHPADRPMVCLKEMPSACLSMPPPTPDAGPDAQADQSDAAASDSAAERKLADSKHWTFDPRKRRLVPRAPFGFVGDKLDPPRPLPGALSPRIARRMGNRSDRYAVAAALGAEPAPEQEAVLDDLANLLRDGVWWVEVQVELTPDPEGCKAQSAAARRAASISRELVQRGIAAKRVSSSVLGKPNQDCPTRKHFFQKIIVQLVPE